jgi:hypothetical protein
MIIPTARENAMTGTTLSRTQATDRTTAES